MSALPDLVAKCSVLSLDVFDTAVVRLVAKPTDLFHFIHAAHRQLYPDAPSLDFARQRIAAEQRARQLTDAREVTLDEIYDAIEMPAGWSAQRLKQLEIEAELRICRRNETIHALYRAALDDGKRVVFVSDMYLSAEVIADILKQTGYTRYSSLYVSSSNKLIKGDGSQFRRVAADLDVAPGRILHIGDNFEADVRAAEQAGISSFHYVPSLRNGAHSGGVPSEGLDTAESLRRALNVFRFGDAAQIEKASFWHRFGYENMGPLLLGFTEWVRQSLVDDGIEQACFLARDGEILKRAYERLIAAGRPGPPALYLYSSRRAFTIPAMTTLDDTNLDFLTACRPGLTVAQYLQRVDLDASLHQAEIRASGFERDDLSPRTATELSQLRDLFRRLERPFLQQMAHERKLIADYLRELGLFATPKLGIIDVGWHGSIQNGLQRIIDFEQLPITLSGYYLGTWAPAARLTRDGQRLRGYVCQDGVPAHTEMLCRLGTEVLEFLHLASHGSVIGFERRADGIKPVLGPNDSDAAKIEAAAELHEGALQFMDDVLEVSRDFPALTFSPTWAFAPIARVIDVPSPTEATRLGELPHTDGYGSAFVISPIARPPSWSALLRDPRLLRREYERSFWRPGFIVRFLSQLPAGDLLGNELVPDILHWMRWYGYRPPIPWRKVYDAVYNGAERRAPMFLKLTKRLLGRSA